MDKIIILVMSIQKKSKNKTIRYLNSRGFENYLVMIPNSIDREIANSYGEHAYVYDTDEIKKHVDFCGTNIENGCAVGRIACNEFIRTHKEFDFAVVLDDDYGGIRSDYTESPTLTEEAFQRIFSCIYKLAKTTGMVLGGYSGGAYPATKNNVMNVFIIDRQTANYGLNKILDEDIFYSVHNWHRGVPTFGLGKVVRSEAQTAEMDKVDGNTKLIYQTDRSYRKSFGAVLADPKNAKLVYNRGNTKRGALWHHEVSWADIKPKIILE